MATDGEPTEPSDDEMLPDERAVIAGRAEELDELDEDEFHDAEDVADALGIDLDTD